MGSLSEVSRLNCGLEGGLRVEESSEGQKKGGRTEQVDRKLDD